MEFVKFKNFLNKTNKRSFFIMGFKVKKQVVKSKRNKLYYLNFLDYKLKANKDFCYSDESSMALWNYLNILLLNNINDFSEGQLFKQMHKI